MKSTCHHPTTALITFLSLCMVGLLSPTPVQATDAVPIHVTGFLPSGYVSDGSVSYQTEIQKAIDSVALSGGEIVFAPITYRIPDAVGLRVHSNLTLRMEGATFLLDEKCAADGQLFLGENVTFGHSGNTPITSGYVPLRALPVVFTTTLYTLAPNPASAPRPCLQIPLKTPQIGPCCVLDTIPYPSTLPGL